ncbi:neurotrypsin-like [Patiria miniata]|uniref:Peptidase S1 domain-containing protein n=1 Tax=Patiria miniata TaxID=46514 RepID=A0A914ACJ9_PATMI|nr:neurotrypsin-like [Patiria miniata]
MECLNWIHKMFSNCRGFSVLFVCCFVTEICLSTSSTTSARNHRKSRRKTKMSPSTRLGDVVSEDDTVPSLQEEVTLPHTSLGVIEDDILQHPPRRLPIAGLTKCGRRPTNPYRRIRRVVGGLTAGTRWPWQAQIIRRDSFGQEIHHCGGTLIDTMHVLTAAHCFDGYHKNDFIIRLGQHDRSTTEPQEQDFAIGCLDIHTKYRALRAGHGYANDIALVTLRGRINGHKGALFNDHVLPACLPQRDEFEMGSNCWVTGWGYSNFSDLISSSFPDMLNEAPVPLQSQKTCRSFYGADLSRKTLCAGLVGTRARADTCQGDSGGPLVCERYGVWKVWGITSWGKDSLCNVRPLLGAIPGVYTRVDQYLHWIERRIERRRRKPVCIN